MSAKDTVRRNKTAIVGTLCGDRMLILNKVHENNLITMREYNNLKSIEKEDVEEHVVRLVDKLMNKGEESCKAFLELLKTDAEIKDTYPELKSMLNETCILTKPVQACSVDDSESKRQKEAVAQEAAAHHLTRVKLEKLERQIAQQENMPLADYYALNNKPRGLCVVINNEDFRGTLLTNRKGTQEDVEALSTVFTFLGFKVRVHNNLTAEDMRQELRMLGSRNFLDEDALVVCVLSHGELGCVFGTDEQKVYIQELTRPFTSKGAPTLAGKPKLFFIQACQGSSYQRGAVSCPPRPRQEEVVRPSLEEVVRPSLEEVVRPSLEEVVRQSLEEVVRQSPLEADAHVVHRENVAWDADFLLGMATMPEHKSFRNVNTGSIYIQELCKQLRRSAESLEKDDILAVLTRVNREVGKGEYLNYKQIPQPKYTLTKKLVLKYV